MYKLLLVTDDVSVADAFQKVPDWEKLDFRVPRVVQSARSAMDFLQKHFVDGIAFSLPEEEKRSLMAFLMERCPQLPIMEAADQVERVIDNVSGLRVLLNQVYADNSDERYSDADAMQRARHSFFRQLLRGKVQGREQAARMLTLLRSRMDLEQPCVMVSFALPSDEGYLAMRWHYGMDRLETAMRNVFGAELEGMRLLVSCSDDDTVCLLACPMVGSEARRADVSVTGLVVQHAENSIEHVREYLGIELQIATITVLPTVTSLADPEMTSCHSF